MADSSGVGSPPKPPGERLAPREEIREVYRLYIMIKYDKSYHRQSLSTKIICSEHNSRKSTRLKNHILLGTWHIFLAKNPEGLTHLSQAAAGRCFSPPELGKGS